MRENVRGRRLLRQMLGARLCVVKLIGGSDHKEEGDTSSAERQQFCLHNVQLSR